jgi:hypothetical protein
MSRMGIWPIVTVGTAMATLGFSLLTRLGPGADYVTAIMLPNCLVAFALGLLFTPLAAAATSTVQPSEAGLASGILSTSRQVGGSLGLAILATVATSRAITIYGGSLPSFTSPEFHSAAYMHAISSGYDSAFWWSAGVTLLALFAGLLLRGVFPVRQVAPQLAVAD